MIDVSSDPQRMRDYLGGRLSDEDQRKFEERLVRDPALVREIELSLRMRGGLERLRAGRELDALVAPGRRRDWRPAAGIAASLVAGIAVWWSLQPSHSGPSVLLAAVERADAARHPAAPLTAEFTLVIARGTSSVPTFELPGNGIVALRMRPASRAAGTGNRVALAEVGLATGPSPMGAIAGVRSGPDGLLTCYAVAARLHPGTYELRVEAEDPADASPSTYRFRLRSTLR
jgi:hypothetical protein